MKTLQKMLLIFGVIGLLYSCQSTNKILSQSDKRADIMNAIANDESMSREMMGKLMESKTGNMMMEQKVKEMKKNMMSEMMNKAKSDTTMMCKMCKAKMENEKMNMDKMKETDKKLKNKEDHKLHH
jgi:predicted metal-binding protein